MNDHPELQQLRIRLKQGELRGIAVLTVEEIAEIFGVNHVTVLRWEEKGLLPAESTFRTLGGHRRFFELYIKHIMVQLGNETSLIEAQRRIDQGKVRYAARFGKTKSIEAGFVDSV